jgi:phosphohistidine phosphatase
MRLLLIRHAIAAPLATPSSRDDDRPLTPRGERRFRHVAEGLARLSPPPRAILTSPLLRARQTAELAAQAWGHPRPQILPALAAGDLRGIQRAMSAFDDDDTLVLVGHEGWISQWTARLLGARSGRGFRFRKGGVACIEVTPGAPHRGRLLWFLPPRMFLRSQDRG